MGNFKKTIKNILPYGVVRAINAKEIMLRDENIVLDDGPKVYNKKGEEMLVYYLQDETCKHVPHTLTYGRVPQDILWDRFNYKLKYHMYTSMDILQTVGQPVKKFAMLREAESIVPKAYEIFKKNPELCREFEAVFTFSVYELNNLPNALFMPGSTVWIGTEMGGGTLDENKYKQKSKNLSMVASQKAMTKYHILRRGIAQKLKSMGLADTYGRFDGGEYLEHIADALEAYRFQVVIENQTSEYAFSEQLLNCFATMTIPIYFGATKVNEFFNMDGIVEIIEKDFDNIEQIAKKIATKEYYDGHIEAVKDNFNRSLEYLSCEDYLLKHYGDKMRY